MNYMHIHSIFASPLLIWTFLIPPEISASSQAEKLTQWSLFENAISNSHVLEVDLGPSLFLG